MILEVSRKDPDFGDWLTQSGLREVRRFSGDSGEAVVVAEPLRGQRDPPQGNRRAISPEARIAEPLGIRECVGVVRVEPGVVLGAGQVAQVAASRALAPSGPPDGGSATSIRPSRPSGVRTTLPRWRTGNRPPGGAGGRRTRPESRRRLQATSSSSSEPQLAQRTPGRGW